MYCQRSSRQACEIWSAFKSGNILWSHQPIGKIFITRLTGWAGRCGAMLATYHQTDWMGRKVWSYVGHICHQTHFVQCCSIRRNISYMIFYINMSKFS
ncbi:hypothetical protein DPMN_108467 [Dreissena polymorpha]|uniref:Uncharacterized protein n=1 Tax=Dreissena polymorpha TaxID=45954 RepID=A0A9D4QL05_DREPO|nr:hypothetical protein DPMN_108467 [Dreissena polymorpha]